MNTGIKDTIDKLKAGLDISDAELALLVRESGENYLRECADKVRRENYSDKVFLRGLIEFTNYCKNDCYYCGIRKVNCFSQRHRLSQEQILDGG